MESIRETEVLRHVKVVVEKNYSDVYALDKLDPKAQVWVRAICFVVDLKLERMKAKFDRRLEQIDHSEIEGYIGHV